MSDSQNGKRLLGLTTVVVAGIFVAGCADLTETEQRTATGALGGATVGGIVGAIAGHTPTGLLVGAAAGAGGGFLYSEYKKHEQSVYDAGVAAGKAED